MGTDLRTTPQHMTDMSAGTKRSGSARTMTIIGFVSAALSVLFFPIVFGPAAIVLGVIAYRKGDPLGMWAAIAGVVGLIAGIALAAAVLGANDTAT